MKILVTGANGYLGQGVVKALLDNGHSVVAADFKTNYVDAHSQRFPQVVPAYVPVWFHRGPRLRVYAPCPAAGRGRAHGPAVCERLPYYAGHGKEAL